MKVKICVSIPARNLSNVLAMMDKAERSGADLIEVRLDYMVSNAPNILNSLKNIAERSSVPLIATNRHISQGGKWKLSEEQRLKTLIKAAESGFTYVDIELTTQKLSDFIEAVRKRGAKIIVSFHNFDLTPPLDEMNKIFKAEVEAGADVCKLVTMANSLADSINCLIFTYEACKSSDLVCFAMGRYGLLSRVLSPIFGASFTFASLETGLETAPGQITIGELREIYERLGVRS